MKCLNCTTIIDQSKTGRKKRYCSDKCRKAFVRKEKTDKCPETLSGPTITALTVPELTDVTVLTDDLDVTPTVTRVASLEGYQSHPDDYAKRTNPSVLNWGPWLDADELQKSAYVSNRVTIPGDWDYSGVGDG